MRGSQSSVSKAELRGVSKSTEKGSGYPSVYKARQAKKSKGLNTDNIEK